MSTYRFRLVNNTDDDKEVSLCMELPDYMSDRIVEPLFMSVWMTVKIPLRGAVHFNLDTIHVGPIVKKITEPPKTGLVPSSVTQWSDTKSNTFDLNLEDGQYVLKTTKQMEPPGFFKIKTHTHVPSPNDEYMVGLNVPIRFDGANTFPSFDHPVALALAPQKALIQLRPKYKFYVFGGTKTQGSLLHRDGIASSATVVDFTSGAGEGKTVVYVKWESDGKVAVDYKRIGAIGMEY